MRTALFALATLAAFATALHADAPQPFAAGTEAKLDGKHQCFEMRTYHAASGKLEALQKRFREHTNALFLKHGMSVVGYWTPDGDHATDTLVYVLAYPSRTVRDEMWKAFSNDPDWKKAKDESERDGKLVDKVDQAFMTPTDYSPVK